MKGEKPIYILHYLNNSSDSGWVNRTKELSKIGHCFWIGFLWKRWRCTVLVEFRNRDGNNEYECLEIRTHMKISFTNAKV